MPITVQNRPVDTLSQVEIDRWITIPVAIAVDVSDAACQIDPAIHAPCPPGRQPRLFGRAVTALCEPPDFGAVLHALDLIQPGDVLVIAANGHGETAMIGETLGATCAALARGASSVTERFAMWHNLQLGPICPPSRGLLRRAGQHRWNAGW